MAANGVIRKGCKRQAMPGVRGESDFPCGMNQAQATLIDLQKAML